MSTVCSVLSVAEISPLMRESMRIVRTGRSGRVYSTCSPTHSTAETTCKHHDNIIITANISSSSSCKSSLVVTKSGYGKGELISLCSSYCVHLFLINLIRPVNKSTKMSHKHSRMLSAKTVNHLHWPSSKNLVTTLSSDRQHLSYDGCLEVRGKIIRTVLCCIVYWSCAQS